MSSIRNRPLAALVFLAAVGACGLAAADELTWKEANHRSAEAVRARKFKEGAQFAHQAFDLYSVQSPKYAPETHAQLLLNLVDAHRRAENDDAALKELDRGVKAIQKKAGPDEPALLPLWEEAFRISPVGNSAVDRYYWQATQLAEKLWGENDSRGIALQARWAMGMRYSKGYQWANAKLSAARERLANAPKSDVLALDIDLNLAKLHREGKNPRKAIPLYQSAIERLEAIGDPDRKLLLMAAYAQLGLAYEDVGDRQAAAATQQRLTASFEGASGPLVPLLRVKPKYPPYAASTNMDGSVTLRLKIAPDGTVSDLTVVDADPPGVFDQAAIDAVRKWKFKPRLKDGQAVEQYGLQVIAFTMAR